MSYSVFLYRENCVLCNKAIEEVAPLFVELGQPLLYQKMTKEYANFIPGLPALILRRDVFNSKQEIIVVGSKMRSQLDILLTQRVRLDRKFL